MKNLFACLFLCFCAHAAAAAGTFPDGTAIPAWFADKTVVDIDQLGTKYRVTDHGVLADSCLVQTAALQGVIDSAAQAGGGVIIIPSGTFRTGALFFKPGTHLHLEEGAVLKGSDDISDYPVIATRMEGQNIKYFPAIVNADGVDGFTLSGKGTVDGNGLRYWKSFWLRRKFNPKCTNLDEMRPRTLFVSNSKDVQISGVSLHNSPFWTSHFYKCDNVKLLGLHIYAPHAPVGAPSSDAVDLDVCSNVLISDCYMSVNDDAVCLKGGKGPWADTDPNNGSNHEIIVENCHFGYCHSALTCGSESIHNRNIIMRNCAIDKADRVFHVKMRPDTPQRYEYIEISDIAGSAKYFLFVRPWRQFYDLKDRKDTPYSYADKITIRNAKFDCDTYINAEASDQYFLTDFLFENQDITCRNPGIDEGTGAFLKFSNVKVNGQSPL